MTQTVFGITPENPYRTIVDRNAFGLNPAPTNGPAVQPEPPVKIDFTGITSFGGQKRAWFIIYPKNPGDPKNNQIRYVNLPEGQRDDILEVVKISEVEGEVTIRNSGADQVLSFKNNAPKGATIAPQPGMPNPTTPVPIPSFAAPVVQNVTGHYPNSGVVAQTAAPVANAFANRYGLNPSGGGAVGQPAGNGLSNNKIAGAPNVPGGMAGSPSAAVAQPAAGIQPIPENMDAAAKTVLQKAFADKQREEGQAKGVAFPPFPPVNSNDQTVQNNPQPTVAIPQRVPRTLNLAPQNAAPKIFTSGPPTPSAP
ncbi:MAG: hypothetical protein M3Y82_08495 [Verrucomicrobiota bacterium]|nr:hypothetical protein [Verrucomicrobiota bacterium]